MKNQKFWRKTSKFNKHNAVTGAALIAIAFTQIPGAIKNAAELACIGQTSNKIWKESRIHSEANMLAVQRCNGYRQGHISIKVFVIYELKAN